MSAYYIFVTCLYHNGRFLKRGLILHVFCMKSYEILFLKIKTLSFINQQGNPEKSWSLKCYQQE